MIADDEHVRIIPVAGTCELTESVLQYKVIDFLPSVSALHIPYHLRSS